MGANVSKTSNKKDFENINKIVSNHMQQSKNTIDNTIDNFQTNDVTFGNISLGGNCKFVIANESDTKQIATGSLTQDETTSMQNEIQASLEEEFKKMSKQVSDAGLSANVDITENDIKTSTQNLTEKTFSKENIQKVSQSIISIQENKVVFGNIQCAPGSNGTIEITNKFVADQIAEALMDELSSNITSSKTVSDIKSKYDQVVDQENKGLFGTIDNAINAGAMIWIVLIICVVGGGMYVISSGGSINKAKFGNVNIGGVRGRNRRN